MTDENQKAHSTDRARIATHVGSRGGLKPAPRWLAVVLWLWTLSAFWSAVVATVAHNGTAGLLYLVCATMLFPPLWRWLPSQGVFLPPAGRIVIGLGALVAAALATVAAYPETKSARGTNALEEKAGSDRAAVKGEPTTAVDRAPKASARTREEETKLAGLLTAYKNLDERDYEGQLAFWDDILPLAPENRDYARKRQEVADKLATLEHLKEHPELGMVVEKVRPRRGGFGTVMLVDFTLRNDSLSDLKDFHITCVGKGRSGSDVDRNSITLYEIVSARRTRTIRDVNMGLVNPQVVSTTCTVDEATIR